MVALHFTLHSASWMQTVERVRDVYTSKQTKKYKMSLIEIIFYVTHKSGVKHKGAFDPHKLLDELKAVTWQKYYMTHWHTTNVSCVQRVYTCQTHTQLELNVRHFEQMFCRGVSILIFLCLGAVFYWCSIILFVYNIYEATSEINSPKMQWWKNMYVSL